MPLIGALSAGCRTILKPSEAMPRVADLLQTSLSAAVDPEVLSVVCGGPEVAAALTEFPLDVLLFTGSHRVGVKVAEASAARLTPLLLELGGKSPVIVDRSADLRRSAEAIAHGKLLNAGQTCVAPDYALVPARTLRAVRRKSEKRGAQTLSRSRCRGDYTAIRSDAAIARLRRLEAGQNTRRAIRVRPEGPVLRSEARSIAFARQRDHAARKSSVRCCRFSPTTKSTTPLRW